MELVLRPIGFPSLAELWQLIRGWLMFADDDDDKSRFIDSLDDPHETPTNDDDDLPDDDPIDPEEDEEDDEEEKGKQKEKEKKAREEREQLFQTKYQAVLARAKKYDPAMYEYLVAKEPDTPEEDFSEDKFDGISSAKMAEEITGSVTRQVISYFERRDLKEKREQAKKQWSAEAVDAQSAIDETAELLGLTEAQAKEAITYAKDLGLNTPLRIATAAITYMKNLSPGEPMTTRERLAEAERQRKAALTGQPEKGGLDRASKKLTKPQKQLAEMRAIQPKDASQLLDSVRLKR